jgi:hypothetical protein
MSNTAIIISGVMRHLVEASSSWIIDADYYLITENKIYNPQSTDMHTECTTDIIANTINRSSVNFSSINLLVDNKMMFTEQQLKQNPEFAYHPTIGMAFKWKYAYQVLLSMQHVRQYNKILLWRPDLYIRYLQPIKNFNNQLPIPDHMHSIGGLSTDPNSDYFSTNDTCLMVDWEMFKILSEFFDYYVYYYNETISNKYDIHSLFARYLIERGKTIDNLLHRYMDCVILRDNINDMFENGMIKHEHSFQDLRNKQNEWWEEKYKDV